MAWEIFVPFWKVNPLLQHSPFRQLKIEGFQPEWCISAMLYSRETLSWLETLKMELPCLKHIYKKADPKYFEGFWLEWCISSIYHAWDTPFWLGTLEWYISTGYHAWGTPFWLETPEWYISTVYHAWGTPFWLGTLEWYISTVYHAWGTPFWLGTLEWYISTIYHAWGTPFWLGTLDLVSCNGLYGCAPPPAVSILTLPLFPCSSLQGMEPQYICMTRMVWTTLRRSVYSSKIHHKSQGTTVPKSLEILQTPLENNQPTLALQSLLYYYRVVGELELAFSPQRKGWQFES